MATEQYEDEWTKAAAWRHAWKCDTHGHHLVVYKPNSGGDWWYAWMDGRFLGKTNLLKVAKIDLLIAANTDAARLLV